MENTTPGWIKLHRSILDTTVATSSEHFHTYVYLYLKANHKDAIHDGVVVKRGQRKTGRKSLSRELNISESKIERILTMLEDLKLIEQQKTNKYRLITVLCYDDEQKSEQQATSEQQQTSADEQQTDNRQTTGNTNKNDKKAIKKEGEEPKEKNTNKGFVRPSFDQVKEYCESRDNAVDPQSFLDYYNQNGWVVGKAKSPMKSWKAAVRTWENKNPKTDEVFEWFYSKYPVPGDKKRALKQWSELSKTKEQPSKQELKDALFDWECYRWDDMKLEEKRFIPKLENWLRDRRFRDYTVVLTPEKRAKSEEMTKLAIDPEKVAKIMSLDWE